MVRGLGFIRGDAKVEDDDIEWSGRDDADVAGLDVSVHETFIVNVRDAREALVECLHDLLII